jgi:hypothetical protein
VKSLYKSVKVIYNAHQKQYEIWYKNLFKWHFDSCYKFDVNDRNTIYYRNKHRAEEMAVERAKGMLNTVEVWRGSNINSGV